jgi:hypothetical protein
MVGMCAWKGNAAWCEFQDRKEIAASRSKTHHHGSDLTQPLLEEDVGLLAIDENLERTLR